MSAPLANGLNMANWRDALKFTMELDPDTKRLKSNGQWLTDDHGITPYGRLHFNEELKMVNTAIEAALEEIEYLRTFVPDEWIDQDTLERLRAKAARDHAALLEFKTQTEQYLARRVSTEEVVA